MYCKCGETLVGDGYSMVVHCPNADIETYWYNAPDEGPIYCDYKEEEDYNDWSNGNV